ncbi:MAG: heme exporter protein CcmB [Bacteroidota bacterium]
MFLRATWAVFRKDVQLELRSRYAINALGMFVAASLVLVLFALGRTEISPPVRAALLWIVILFAACVGLGRAFVAEEERGTTLLLQLHVPPSAVYTGKLLYNIALTLGLNLAAAAGFLLVTGAEIAAPGLLVLTLILGAVGLAGATTLLAAIIARASGGAPLLAVLAFPVLVPLLFSVVNLTERATRPFTAGLWTEALPDLTSLIGFAGLLITASALLFDYVWTE